MEIVVPDEPPAASPDDLATGITGAGVETAILFACGAILAGVPTEAGTDAEAAISFAAGVLTTGTEEITGLAGAGAAGLAATGVDAAARFSVAGTGVFPTGADVISFTDGAAVLAPGADMSAAASLSFATDDATFLETPGVADGPVDFASGGILATGPGPTAVFAGSAFFATGGADAALVPAGGSLGVGAENFLADFFTEDFLAMAPAKLPRREMG